jgi:subtilisin family serine protease
MAEEVSYVQEDQVMRILQSCATQKRVPSWGLNRICTKKVFLDGNYNYGIVPPVEVFVIDSGIYFAHTDFGGRARWGGNFIDNNNQDCNGHGTHVAGTIGGTKYGVAKNVSLIAVKVMNCDGRGTDSTILKGINFAVNPANRKGRSAVINMSIGGAYSRAENDAVAAGVRAGLVFVIASGNDNKDACQYSPTSEPTCISVGATTIDQEGSRQYDERSEFSNYGSCVHILAPGSTITSTWIGDPNAIMTLSGTSMASPHVAGAAALYLAARPSATPAEVKNYLLSQAGTSVDMACNYASNPTSCSKTPNKFLYSACSA